MSIKKDSVVTFNYTLKDDEGAVIDSSAPGEPLAYLHGHGNIVPGLERELEGRAAHDKLSVKVAPADAYGEYNRELVQKVPRRNLKGIAKVTYRDPSGNASRTFRLDEFIYQYQPVRQIIARIEKYLESETSASPPAEA